MTWKLLLSAVGPPPRIRNVSGPRAYAEVQLAEIIEVTLPHPGFHFTSGQGLPLDAGVAALDCLMARPDPGHASKFDMTDGTRPIDPRYGAADDRCRERLPEKTDLIGVIVGAV